MKGFEDASASRGASLLDALAREAGELPPQVELLAASSLKPEPIRWLWPGYLAGGKLHILAGQPGTGKTTLALSLAATVTTGGVWPDGARAMAGNVILWSGEDDPLDTLVPRLMAAGADLSRAHLVGGVLDGDKKRGFDPAKDMQALLDAARVVGGVKLLIVDPVVSAVAGDSHKNSDTRRALQPLVDFGKYTGAAILGISHFSKGTAGRDPLERLSGSLAFGALARLVFGAVVKKSENGDEESRVFCRIKSNIGPDGGGFAYALEYDDLAGGIVGARVAWGQVTNLPAREILADADAGGEERSARGDASEFLRDLLADGPVLAKQAISEASDCGHSKRTLDRAKKDLSVQAVKRGFGKDNKAAWYWELPVVTAAKVAEERQKSPSKNVGNLGNLRGSWQPSVVIEDAEVF